MRIAVIAVLAAILAVTVVPAFGQGYSRATIQVGETIPPSQMATVAQDPELKRLSQELEIVQAQLAQAEKSGDSSTVKYLQPQIIAHTERIRDRIVSVTHVPVNIEDVIPVLRRLGLWGPTSGWAKGQVSEAYRNGRLFGYHKGATADEEQGQRPATRQELAAVGNRVAEEGARNLDYHATREVQEHQSLWGAIHGIQMWMWIIPLCLLLALLLYGLYRLSPWSRRRRCPDDGGDESRDPVGWAQRGSTNGNTSKSGGRWPQGGLTTH
jgi:hypothetical protein